MRVYLAGPDVFLRDAAAQGERKKAICRAHGLEPRFPLDVSPADTRLAKPAQAEQLFRALCALMDECELAIANLTPFRGPSLDAGTAFEIGYMHAQGKPVFGYTNDARDYEARARDAEMAVEAFELCDNLMIEGPLLAAGRRAVRAAARADELHTSLAAFERCVREAAASLATR